MKRNDFKCESCGHNQEIWITEINKNFPDFISCRKCAGKSFRIFSPLHGIIHQGRVGNSKNGYQSSHCKIGVKKT